MKKIFVSTLILAGILTGSCNKNNGCSRSVRGTVKVFTEDDESCGKLIELEDGSKLIPSNWADHNGWTYNNGDAVWVSYKETSGASECDLGEVVKLRCLALWTV